MLQRYACHSAIVEKLAVPMRGKHTVQLHSLLTNHNSTTSFLLQLFYD